MQRNRITELMDNQTNPQLIQTVKVDLNTADIPGSRLLQTHPANVATLGVRSDGTLVLGVIQTSEIAQKVANGQAISFPVGYRNSVLYIDGFGMQDASLDQVNDRLMAVSGDPMLAAQLWFPQLVKVLRKWHISFYGPEAVQTVFAAPGILNRASWIFYKSLKSAAPYKAYNAYGSRARVATINGQKGFLLVFASLLAFLSESQIQNRQKPTKIAEFDGAITSLDRVDSKQNTVKVTVNGFSISQTSGTSQTTGCTRTIELTQTWKSRQAVFAKTDKAVEGTVITPSAESFGRSNHPLGMRSISVFPENGQSGDQDTYDLVEVAPASQLLPTA